MANSSCSAEIEIIPFTGYRLSGEFIELNSVVALDVGDSNTKEISYYN